MLKYKKEIKFRAWSFSTKDFVNPARIELSPHGNLFDLYGESIEIQQFTGLKDKNDNDIYEGDIVKDLDGDNCVVEFNHGSFIIRGKVIIPFWSILSVNGECSARTISPKTFEIIGNIFENPQLLNPIQNTQLSI